MKTTAASEPVVDRALNPNDLIDALINHLNAAKGVLESTRATIGDIDRALEVSKILWRVIKTDDPSTDNFEPRRFKDERTTELVGSAYRFSEALELAVRGLYEFERGVGIDRSTIDGLREVAEQLGDRVGEIDHRLNGPDNQ